MELDIEGTLARTEADNPEAHDIIRLPHRVRRDIINILLDEADRLSAKYHALNLPKGERGIAGLVNNEIRRIGLLADTLNTMHEGVFEYENRVVGDHIHSRINRCLIPVDEVVAL